MNHYPFELEPLTFAYDSLEPMISKTTLEYHHDKHLQAYVNNLNNALSACEQLHACSIEAILSDLEAVPCEKREAVRNHGGGVFNHNFYFSLLKHDVAMSNKLEQVFVEAFGSIDAFVEQFTKASMSLFGSGWAWVVVNKRGELEIVQTKNQDTPLKDGLRPILTIDLWEHAYYLDYQNRRGSYVENYLKVIDWQQVETYYKEACGRL